MEVVLWKQCIHVHDLDLFPTTPKERLCSQNHLAVTMARSLSVAVALLGVGCASAAKAGSKSTKTKAIQVLREVFGQQRLCDNSKGKTRTSTFSLLTFQIRGMCGLYNKDKSDDRLLRTDVTGSAAQFLTGYSKDMCGTSITPVILETVTPAVSQRNG